jgi:lysozyme
MTQSLPRRCAAIILTVLVTVVCLAGCGGGSSQRAARQPADVPSVVAKSAPTCTVRIGQGAPGACAPVSIAPRLAPPLAAGSTTFPDLSNNNPVYDFSQIAKTHPAVWLKANEGTGYVDPTFASMARAAKRAGIAPGGYDFVRTYSSAEANLFVKRLKATGTCRSKNTLPPTLDVEVGSASASGVQTMANIVHRACGRVAVYTGLWYWTPHLGSWWPSGAYAWISGYPSIVGRANYARISVHQYTDRGFNGSTYSDMNVWLGAGSFSAFVHKTTAKPKPWHGKGTKYPFHSKRGWYRVVLKYNNRHHKLRYHSYGPHDAIRVHV